MCFRCLGPACLKHSGSLLIAGNRELYPIFHYLRSCRLSSVPPPTPHIAAFQAGDIRFPMPLQFTLICIVLVCYCYYVPITLLFDFDRGPLPTHQDGSLWYGGFSSQFPNTL